MKPKETTIRLNRDDLKCLENGGSIDFEITYGGKITAVVTVAIESESKGFRFPRNSTAAEIAALSHDV